MIRLWTAAFIALTILADPTLAQERVVVGTQRLTDNGALFLAAAEGYFKAEGIDLGMTAYGSDQAVAETLASGTTDFGLAGFTPAAFNLAGKGLIKAIAGQVREKRGFEGTEIVASNFGYNKGLHKFEDLANRSIAIGALGSVSHYQLEQIARIKHIDFNRMTVKSMKTLDAIARAIGTNEVDAAIMPASFARELLAANQAKLVGWYSELDEQQFGALFVSAKMINTRRDAIEKFMRAYRRGVDDYAAALLRKDRNSKRTSDTKSHETATTIARYVYPDRAEGGAAAVEASAYFIEPQARLDVADIERQIAWYKAQGLVDKSVNARDVIDLGFVK
ncbi:MAG TPA: ABC transporter substrate-binding protein [Pseudolabrys sp.]|nr:ABC transporter substrate-binding protein [Pseudolabrys sp.]